MYFVFCLTDRDPEMPPYYTVASHTVFPTVADAETFAQTINQDRKPIVIHRDQLIDAIARERRDFHERLPGVYPKDFNMKLRVYSHSHPAMETTSWVEFRKKYAAFASHADFLEISRLIAGGAKDVLCGEIAPGLAGVRIERVD